MAGVVAAIGKAEAERASRAAAIEKGAKAILERWGPIINQWRGPIPAEAVAVRIQVESGGNPKAGPTKQGERGLLQIWPKTAEKYGVTDPFDPAQNIRAGLLHWRAELARMKGKLPGLFPSVNDDFLAALQLYTAIGSGATPYLLKTAGVRPGSEYSDLVNWLKQTGEGLEAHRSYFGTQSAASVARRIIYAGNMTAWAKPLGGAGLGLVLAAAGIAYLIYRWRM
jgi:hypothetical protein